MNKHIIEVDSNKCVGCELCVHDCPVNNINISENKACIYKQNCLKCGHCVAICPKNAVMMTGFEEMPEDIKEFQTLNSDILMDALKQKRSFRQFKNQDISVEIIEKIIEAVRLTPTAKNTQDGLVFFNIYCVQTLKSITSS